jgi:hypothetical protein
MWTDRLINMMLFEIKPKTENQCWEKDMILPDVIVSLFVLMPKITAKKVIVKVVFSAHLRTQVNLM